MLTDNRRPAILIVDDAPDIISMLQDAVSFEGMKPFAASSGDQAIGLVEENRPDIILLDAMMPGITGFETCRILKAEKHCEDVPVIFMTGFDDSEHVVRAFESGGVDFVAKPIILDQLFARMRVHLMNARRAQSAQRALDSTGRKIVACDAGGKILWHTPQAAGLLRRAGLRADEGAHLPWDFARTLSVPTARAARAAETAAPYVHKTPYGMNIEFRILEGSDGTEKLIRLIDGTIGTDEEKLAAAFNLTLREGEVLLWLTHGKSNKEIAEILTMSPRTVNKHLEQIFNKLGVENRTAAATLSVKIIWDDS